MCGSAISGCGRLWQELSRRHPSFEFVHGHGLGVLAVGAELPRPLEPLFEAAADPPRRRRPRDFFARLGDPLMRDVSLSSATAALHALEHQSRVLEDRLADAVRDLEIERVRAAEATTSAERLAADRIAAATRELEAEKAGAAARIAAVTRELEAERARTAERSAALTRELEAEKAQAAGRIAAIAREIETERGRTASALQRAQRQAWRKPPRCAICLEASFGRAGACRAWRQLRSPRSGPGAIDGDGGRAKPP